jgi:TOMM system kinase/cyclase fusion protein
MRFSEVVAQTLAWLQREGRVSYRALKREFELDDEFLEDVKTELIEAKRIAADEDGKVLLWAGAAPVHSSEFQVPSSSSSPNTQHLTPNTQTLDPRLSDPRLSAAERRQLTVMFCDLVGSTALSARLDPEELREIVRAYQQTCAEVISRHEGYIAQYLGDGLLVYFGYPTAHEDDARRAMRAGLEIIAAIAPTVPSPFQGEGQGEGSLSSLSSHSLHPNPLPKGARGLQVRIGIHTGLVVIGDIGASGRTEQLALGETPNIAARIQGLAEPNTVLISAATQRLIEGQFEFQPFGSHLVKGIDAPIAVYHVLSERQSASPLAGRATLTPLVGREQEVGLLLDRWEQVKEGRGQVVLLSGEPGIGKSRLAYTLREHVTSEGSLLFEARCSPYHQHSALYPLIDVLQRILLLTRQETDDEKVEKLERILALYSLPETLPLFTALLSLPTPSQYPPLTFTPQKQKERTLQALLQLLVAQAERQATVSVWEDLHWADPSSLEFLSLLIEQIPTTKLLLVVTFRPEFTPPWKPRSHISQLVLNRLGKKQVEAMIEKVTEGQALSTDVIEQIRVKTDGVPLFVEELTKAVIEAEIGVGARHAVSLQTIPATLQEALLARLDRLSTARQVAQLGATLGREFSHELLQAVAPLSETDLHTALTKLVEAEILYQRGVGQQTRYFFKHALIQDTAYQSLLKSTRQQYHQQIAQILEERFPETKETQPEFVAHHYTEAGLIEQAILYWQQAGQKAVARSANVEAISHLTKGLELLKTLPDTPERTQHELTLHLTLGVPLAVIKGCPSPEVERAYSRALELCRQMGETPELFPIVGGLWQFYLVRAEHQTARQLGEQLLSLAQSVGDPALLVEAHRALGEALLNLGELIPAREHFEQGIALYDPQQHRSLAFLYGFDPGVFCLSFAAWALWSLGYPDQALKRSHEALALARERAHPHSLAAAFYFAAIVHQFRREGHPAQERAEAAITLATEQGSPHWLAYGTSMRGWALAEQDQGEEGIAQMRQGLAALHVIGAEIERVQHLALLAEAYGKVGQAEEGLRVLGEALALVDKNEERYYEAELYRLRGELTLQQSSVQGLESRVKEAEECFLKAIEIAQRQQAKSLELRATTSLARLWQQQGTQHEARNTLSEVYGWFTEGFDTKDLQEAKALWRNSHDSSI